MIGWQEYFFTIAEAISKKSHCLSRKLGAIAVHNGKFIVATGYSGPPMGYPHCEGTECPRHKLGYKSGQGLEICPSAHAELNVLAEAARLGTSLKDCTLYLSGPSPCRECSKAIVNAGITEVVFNGDIEYPDIGLSGVEILKTCGVKLTVRE